MQPPPGSIRAFFKPASKLAGAKRASGGSAAAAPAAEAPSDAIAAASEPAAAAADQLPPPPAVFARKRRRPSGGGSAGAAAEPTPAAAAAAAAGGDGAPAAAAGPSSAPATAAAAVEGGAAAGSRTRQLTQMYLDVGQRHFHAYRCPACGMLYARGTEADERLHAAFHASATQGPRYQGWAGERVVQLDGSKGRVLLFGSADQGRPRKQLADLCSFLEEQMGLSKGWLLQAPLTVLLYVSAARRVQGFVAAEPIKEAYCARPSLPPAAAQGMLSCGSAVQPASGSGAAHAADAAATVAPFEGHPTAAAAAAQAHVATSGRSLLSVTLSTGAAAAECSSSAAAEGAGGGAPAAAAPAAAEAGDGEVAAAAGCTPGLPTSLQQQQQAQPEAQQAQQQLQQTQQPPVLPPLELDRSRRVRAVCGVRLMWVSLEARRRGLASRLLDCCRSHFMPGYVLSRHELAFSAPTDDGRAFIEQYAGSRKFLVYE